MCRGFVVVQPCAQMQTHGVAKPRQQVIEHLAAPIAGTLAKNRRPQYQPRNLGGGPPCPSRRQRQILSPPALSQPGKLVALPGGEMEPENLQKGWKQQEI